MHDYDVENQFELGELADDSDEEVGGRKRTSFDADDVRLNGRKPSGSMRLNKESVRPNAKGQTR